MVTVLHTGRFLSLVREGHWEYAERVNATGAVIIVAVTDERKLLLVEQYRIPCHAQTIELPAGITGDEPELGSESQAECARRELLEETGYAAGQMERLTAPGPASSGLTSELVTFFRAHQLCRAGQGGGVAQEAITVHEVPLEGLEEWLSQKAAGGALVDPKVFTGLYFLARAGDLGAVKAQPSMGAT
jgi:ADP-ribose pyrophosphatase